MDGLLQETWKFSCDQDGKVIKKEKYNQEGKLSSYWLFSYNDNNQVKRKDIYSPSNTLRSYIVYSYDIQGLEDAYTWFNADGTERFSYEFQYSCN